MKGKVGRSLSGGFTYGNISGCYRALALARQIDDFERYATVLVVNDRRLKQEIAVVDIGADAQHSNKRGEAEPAAGRCLAV